MKLKYFDHPDYLGHPRIRVNDFIERDGEDHAVVAVTGSPIFADHVRVWYVPKGGIRDSDWYAEEISLALAGLDLKNA